MATAALALAAAFAQIPPAQAQWALCGPGAVALPERPALDFEVLDPELVYASGDEGDAVEIGVTELRGEVKVARDTQQLEADRVRITRPEDILEAHGNVRIWDIGLFAAGERAEGELEADRIALEPAEYVVLDAHAHGEAARVELTGRNHMGIDRGTYTTCDPGNEDWVLSATRVDLDKVSEFGTARNVTVKFHGIPIFYSPWMTFPLTDRRKSGFLTPSFRVAGETGFEATVPYYWNIAPNMDATFGVRHMTRRGTQLQGEYRYLFPWGEGELGVEVLPNDEIRDEPRAAVDFDHEGRSGPWFTFANVEWVSDDRYFEELGTELSISARRFLERRGDVRYSGTGWAALGRVQDFVSVDRTVPEASRPHKRLPQLRFWTTGPLQNRALNLDLDSEFVNFERGGGVTGTRIDLKPSVSYPVRTAGAFVIPKLSLEYTGYALDGLAPGEEDNPDRLLPIASVDAGLVFEREFELAGEGMVQTLEPRVFYLYVPFEDQDDIPLFDTGRFTFSFAQLFRENRFSGADRLGDANQASVALTTRLLPRDGGEEWLRASIGQIRFFRDRRVQFPRRPAETASGSNVVGEVAAKVLGEWRLLGGFQWDPGEDRTARATAQLRYSPDPQRVVNFAYRFIRERVDPVEQTDVSFRWPVRHDLGVVGRWLYSLPEERTLEAVGGIEYESCCWAARAVLRRFVNSVEGDFDTGVFLQLELKGLAGVGREAADFVRQTVPGYRNTF